MLQNILDAIPLPLVLIATIIVVLLAIEAGFRIGLWRSRSREFDSEAQLSAMTGANLALLAFILAFSFNQAAGYYEQRKQLILEEANAIGTAYLRAGLVKHSEGQEIQRKLRDYIEHRATVASENRPDLQREITVSQDIQSEIWSQVKQLSHRGDINILDSLLIQSINQVLDIHEQRVAAGLRSRIPQSIWLALFTLLILSMLGIGHFSGMKGRRNPVTSTALALSFALVLFLIADLDRPSSGLVQADHSALLILNERIEQADSH